MFYKTWYTKRKNYKKVEELSQICRAILSTNIDVGFSLEEVIFITDKHGFINDKWELEIDKKKQENFYNITEQRFREIKAFVPYKQLQSEDFTIQKQMTYLKVTW